MEVTKWNLIDELSNKEIILGYLLGAFEDNPTKEHIIHALDTAKEAIKTHNICPSSSEAVVSD